MTKTIRIENADTSDWRVDVEVWDVVEGGKLVLVAVHQLDNPATMKELYITNTRHLVVKEFGPGSKARTQ